MNEKLIMVQHKADCRSKMHKLSISLNVDFIDCTNFNFCPWVTDSKDS